MVDPVLRLRQICLLSRDLEWTSGVLSAAFNAPVVFRDPRIASSDLESAHPGESVRIWPVRDVIEPRIKVDGPWVIYPGACGRSITTVGSGRTHRLSGMGITEVSSVNWHDAGGDYVDICLDMSGHWADVIPQSKLINLCLVVEPDPGLGNEAQNDAVHKAALVVKDSNRHAR